MPEPTDPLQLAKNFSNRISLLPTMALSLAAGAMCLLPGAVTFAIGVNALAPSMVQAQADPLDVYVKAGIDATQHAQITELASQLEQTNIGRSHEIMDLIKEIRTLSLQPDLDEKKILAAQNKINELQGAMAIDRLKLNMKVRKLLNPEQRTKLVSIIREQRSMPSQPSTQSASQNQGHLQP
ncbi:MAG: periplasmic heavy metal sensor [Candidatus Melainabacteria bacterium]|nr:MAG: periplasmic heavy metal sensor [Candidatus Melainabacteria bacterium]